MYSVSMTHVPGGWHAAPDALSRYPVSHPDKRAEVDMSLTLEEATQIAVLSTLYCQDSSEGLQAVTWERVCIAAADDVTSKELVQVIANGFPSFKTDLPPTITAYWNIREILSSIDGVPLAGRRIIIPSRLRGEILDILHAAHQGVRGMRDRAKMSVYWPNIQQRNPTTTR
jgi:hypothetical protein